MKNLRMIGIGVAVVGALVTSWIMCSTTSAAEGLSDLLFTLGLYAWVLLPFAVLVALTWYVHRRGFAPAPRVASVITSVVVVITSVFVYWSSIFGSESSTSALVFVFLPLYALVGTVVLYGLVWLLLKPFLQGSKV
jgi:hypothetical protein